MTSVRRAPWYLLVPSGAAGLGVALPLAYLLGRAAASADLAGVLLRPSTLVLLVNTALLAAAVLVVVTVLGVPAALFTTRSDLPARGLWSLLAVLPLAVPGYLLAYTLLALGGHHSTLQEAFGFTLPQLGGFWGAVVALGLYNTPYMFLNVRAALQRGDPALEEAARSMGHSALGVFMRVTLPQLRPAYLAGALLVVLHVLGDFGVVSLMRYETFTLALFRAYQSVGGFSHAAGLALVMVAVAVLLLVVDLRFLGHLRLDPVRAAPPRRRGRWRLGWWKWPAVLFMLVPALVAVVVPALTILYWMGRAPVRGGLEPWWGAVTCSLSAAVPAAFLAGAVAVPVVWMGLRYPSRLSRMLEASAYLGYAVPAIAFALALVFFALRFDAVFGSHLLYQSLALLVAALTLHFMAEALGPIRATLLTATPRLEEAARALGRGPLATFFRVSLPLLRPGLAVAVALVFLSAMKELPLTILLRPAGFETLATRLWTHSENVEFAAAAPYALTVLAVSATFVGLVLLRPVEERA